MKEKKYSRNLPGFTQGKTLPSLCRTAAMSSAMQALVELFADCNRRYQEKKAEKGMLDFNDWSIMPCRC
jgi:ATP-dependent exoDNAse (exonuclease V) beta subunit